MLFDDPENDADDDLFPSGDDDDAPAAQEPDAPRTPRTQLSLLGHEAIEKHLLGLLASDRFPSTLIFNGIGGIGKSAMAFRLARYLFKHKNGEDDGGGLFGGFDESFAAPTDSLFVAEADPVFQQVASGGYPDLLVIEREIDDKGKVKNHDLETVRSVTQFFRRTASQGGWRIAIVDDADAMNWHAQNALLKILEEPPKKSLLILICHRIGALLPTILSRSQVVTFHPLNDDHIRDILRSDFAPHEKHVQDRILRMAAGSISRAKLYADPEISGVMDSTAGLLAGWPKLDWIAIQHFAEAIGGKGAGDAAQTAFRDAMMNLFYSLARAKSLGMGHELGSLLTAYSQPALLRLCEDLTRHFETVATGNLDKRFMVMGAYALFER